MERKNAYLSELISRYPILAASESDIWNAYLEMEEAFRNNGKILIAGNGGSFCDAQHMVAELMKGFQNKRRLGQEMENRLRKVSPERGAVLAEKLQLSLPAVALDVHGALSTAFANDVDARLGFAQQVLGYGRNGDIFLGISTSGNSENVIYAAVTARAAGMAVIALTGRNGGRLAEYAHILVNVPEQETYAVQEMHLPIYHCWCRMLEETFFG